jgi:hypothetical protein
MTKVTIDPRQLHGMSPKEAINFLVETYGLSKDDALDFWVNNTPTEYADVVTLSPEEYKVYVEESKQTSTYLFSMGGKKKTDQPE